MARAKSRKKPCSICGKWFLPDNRRGKEHKTCSKECSKERHRRNCDKWNNRNKPHTKANYLSKKLNTVAAPRVDEKGSIVLPAARLNLDLPRGLIQEELGAKHLIIIEYIFEQFSHRVPLLTYQPEKGRAVFKTRLHDNYL